MDCHGSNMSAVDTMYSCSAISSGAGEGVARCPLQGWCDGDDTPPWYNVAPSHLHVLTPSLQQCFSHTVILHDYNDYMLHGVHTDSFIVIFLQILK